MLPIPTRAWSMTLTMTLAVSMGLTDKVIFQLGCRYDQQQAVRHSSKLRHGESMPPLSDWQCRLSRLNHDIDRNGVWNSQTPEQMLCSLQTVAKSGAETAWRFAGWVIWTCSLCLTLQLSLSCSMSMKEFDNSAFEVLELSCLRLLSLTLQSHWQCQW